MPIICIFNEGEGDGIKFRLLRLFDLYTLILYKNFHNSFGTNQMSLQFNWNLFVIFQEEPIGTQVIRVFASNAENKTDGEMTYSIGNIGCGVQSLGVTKLDTFFN